MGDAKVLAKGPMGRVAICECCVVHVDIPGISLHLNDWQFLSLAKMMNDASEKIMNTTLRILTEEREDPKEGG